MKNVMNMCNHMVTWSLVALVGVMSNTTVETILLRSFMGAFVAAVCFLMRQKIKKIGHFIIGHLLCFMAIVGGVILWQMGAGLAFLLCLSLVWSLFLRFNEGMEWFDAPRGFYVGTGVVVYFIAYIYRMPSGVKTWIVVATMMLYLNKLLYEKFDAADRFIDLGTLSTQINTARAKTLCKKMILVYCGVLTAVITVLGVIGIDGFWKFLGKMGYKLMRFIGQFLPEGEPPVQTEEVLPPESVGETENIFGEMAKEIPIVQTIGKIFFAIMGVVTAIVLISVVVWVIIDIYRRFGKKKVIREEELIREKISGGSEKRKLRKGRGLKLPELSAAKKVRKLYKKNMSKQADKYRRRFPYQSPKMQIEVLETQEPTREEIQEIYERARYSTENVTDADVKRLHRIM